MSMEKASTKDGLPDGWLSTYSYKKTDGIDTFCFSQQALYGLPLVTKRFLPPSVTPFRRASVMSKKCVNCKTVNPSNAIHCWYCGEKIKDEQKRIGKIAVVLATLVLVGGIIAYLLLGKSAPVGRLSLICTKPPTGAQIYVDNEYQGTTQTTIKLKPGQYPVRVEAAGYQPNTQTVQIEEGKTKQLSVALPLAWGTFTVSSTQPKVAKVYLDNLLKGSTPITIDKLEPKVYNVKVEANGYEPKTESVDIEAGKTKTLTVALVSTKVSPSGDSKPVDVMSILVKAEGELKAGRLDSVSNMLKQAKTLSPTHSRLKMLSSQLAEAYYSRARTHHQNGEPGEAIPDYEKAISWNKRKNYYLNWAWALFETDKIESAKVAVTEGLALRPADSTADGQLKELQQMLP